jgi:RNA polymerase sigma-B factor
VPLDPGAEAAATGEFSEGVEDHVALSGAISALPRRERTILRLRFVEGLTQTEIADRVGLSQMYVSRLLRATLESLRNEIESD